MRVVFFATHPGAHNGYSLIAYELIRRISKRPDVSLYWYGFQNVTKDKTRNNRPLPDVEEVYDAMANEDPKANGFGMKQIPDYVKKVKPDLVIIYNDFVVVDQVIKQLQIPGLSFKIMVYQDLVYEHIKPRFVELINEKVDSVLAFTPLWAEEMKKHGINKPIEVLRHGFNPEVKFPIDKKIARKYFGLGDEDFIILNINRNQPRKRWDIVMKAFAEFVSRHRGEKFKLFIGTAVTGAWNLMEIYKRELAKRDISFEEGQKHIIIIDTPQKLSDEEINILLSCGDIGISAADGEGFGLCNFEHAGIGRPQVVSKVGGFKDFFDDDRAVLCDPVLNYYVDASRDGVGGEAQLIDYSDLTEGMELYYANPEMREKHGQRARRYILDNYSWADIASTLYDACCKTVGVDNTVVQVADVLECIPDVGQTLAAEEKKVEPPSVSTPVAPPVSKTDLEGFAKMSDITDLNNKIDLLTNLVQKIATA